MIPITIVYWRDIPAQVIVGSGRKAAKKQLEERFEKAIDRCAMKINAKDANAYLSEWRKEIVGSVEGNPQEVVKAEATRLEEEYTNQILVELINNNGKTL
jgi:hypothetical protein